MAVHLAFGDFELDEARFELRYRRERVTIQPKALELIFYLARHRDRVVSKDELFETVWDGTVVAEGSLARAVSLARKALRDTPTAQGVIRTVRGKGLQFVAAEQPRLQAQTQARPAAPRVPERARPSTQLETAHDEARSCEGAAEVPVLFAALDGEAPSHGSASWSLEQVDEVHIQRGSQRRTRREPGLTRVLTITVPGLLLSRKHARLVRTASGWLAVDDKSRNGTFVNGERVSKREIAVGDVIECGRTMFLFATAPRGDGLADDVDSSARERESTIFDSVTPAVLALEQDLMRVAPASLPVLLLGESGVGKSRVAEALHRHSGRDGALVRLDAGAAKGDLDASLGEAAGGTVVLERLDRMGEPWAARLGPWLESAPTARIICTSQAPFAMLEQHVPRDLLSRLAGYRCELPPLRARLGDLGALLGALLAERLAARSIEAAAARALLAYRWPGNLRELEMVVDAAAVLAGEGTIRIDHLPAELQVQRPKPPGTD